MHSGSLDGSLIKLTPYCELDYNFSNGHKLQNPDFDSASDDTTSVTIIERPQMPQFEAVLVHKMDVNGQKFKSSQIFSYRTPARQQ